MTERAELPEPEDFAAEVQRKMQAEGRKWAWLAGEVGISVNTLRSQIVEEPSRLKLATAKRVATALGMSVWIEAA